MKKQTQFVKMRVDSWLTIPRESEKTNPIPQATRNIQSACVPARRGTIYTLQSKRPIHPPLSRPGSNPIAPHSTRKTNPLFEKTNPISTHNEPSNRYLYYLAHGFLVNEKGLFSPLARPRSHPLCPELHPTYPDCAPL